MVSKKMFMNLHGKLDVNELPQLNYIIANGGIGSITMERYREVKAYLGCEDTNILVEADGMYSVLYYKDHVLQPLYDFEVETLKMLQVKERIEALHFALNDYRKGNVWELYFTLVDKRILFPVYFEEYFNIPDKLKYKVFKDIYMRSESGFNEIPIEILTKIYYHAQSDRDYRRRMEQLMHEAEMSGGRMIVYRGCVEGYENGYSWTVDKKVAEFFASRFEQNGKVLTRYVRPSAIMDYLTDRGEKEVIVNPELME